MYLDAIFLAAHPDDAELSCGGTIIKLVNSGKKIGIIDLTGAELSTRGNLQSRKQETELASKALGIIIRENVSLRDGNIQNTPEIRIKLIKLLRKYRPNIIFFPYFNDRHPDHKNANTLIRESAFYSGLVKIETELDGKKQDAFRPSKNYYYMQTYTFEPSFIVDISNEFEKKMEAVRCYSSQFYKAESKEPNTFISDKKFMEYLEARAVYYGFQIGVKYGEPFFSEEKIKFDVDDLFNC